MPELRHRAVKIAEDDDDGRIFMHAFLSVLAVESARYRRDRPELMAYVDRIKAGPRRAERVSPFEMFTADDWFECRWCGDDFVRPPTGGRKHEYCDEVCRYEMERFQKRRRYQREKAS